MISGDIIREARLRARLTQRELATRARTSQPAVARWESGAVVPSFERLRELIRACGLELTIGLATYDDSYDEWILGALKKSPAERLEAAARAAEAWSGWRDRLEAARERASV
ncbi:MAG: helix-turn-helix transcriptional regulator [Gaiellaceae bacterium]